jgi:hypothetical protein
MLYVFYIDVAKVDRDVAHVAMVFSSLCPKYFICFKCMLQVFHLDVAKLDLDVAYTCMLQEYVSSVLDFHMYVASAFLVFQTYVASVSSVLNVCYKYFI